MMDFHSLVNVTFKIKSSFHTGINPIKNYVENELEKFVELSNFQCNCMYSRKSFSRPYKRTQTSALWQAKFYLLRLP